jgi:CheY-like chemotaxis protein
VNGAEPAVSQGTAKSDAVPADRRGVAHTEIRGTKVLIVDDDMRNIYALTALLERSAAEVVQAQSGFAALEILEQHRDFTVVLMDIMMPIMDGYETIRAIRKSGHSSGLPIIAVTGKAVGGERYRCLAAGADDYVPKPVNSVQLLAALAPWVSPTAMAS